MCRIVTTLQSSYRTVPVTAIPRATLLQAQLPPSGHPAHLLYFILSICPLKVWGLCMLCSSLYLYKRAFHIIRTQYIDICWMPVMGLCSLIRKNLQGEPCLVLGTHTVLLIFWFDNLSPQYFVLSLSSPLHTEMHLTPVVKLVITHCLSQVSFLVRVIGVMRRDKLTINSWCMDTCLDFHGSPNSLLPLPWVVRFE